MTVKFYDSIRYSIPMIVNSKSYMGKIVEERGLGITVDLEKECDLEILYKKISDFDYKKYTKANEIIYNEILNDDKKFRELLLDFERNKFNEKKFKSK